MKLGELVFPVIEFDRYEVFMTAEQRMNFKLWKKIDEALTIPINDKCQLGIAWAATHDT